MAQVVHRYIHTRTKKYKNIQKKEKICLTYSLNSTIQLMRIELLQILSITKDLKKFMNDVYWPYNPIR